ncbi:MAG TPA: urease accessory protein UreE [Methylibium sp.]|uniref:urease accessory protein UreE n=1 Tax=Methylibium sp. TaxID=2067992 RepID=UPI002DB918EA|nr:urease accessory protein UreE [Methylibium sp.]HEU4458640.1 urease accessory protein UreE [Methylibium sp.]
MLMLTKILPRAAGLAPALVKRAPSIELDWDARQKSRLDATDSEGRALAIFLPRGTVLRGGDVLVAEDGSLRRVLAAAQPVMAVTACVEHGSPFDLLRAAYHLGNRHVALELRPDRLQFEPDHVLAEMLRAMHLVVTETHAAFEPEAGAYAGGGHRHGALDHGHGHEHQHGHAPSATARGKPIGIAVAAAPHVHGPGCGHDH